MSGKRPSGRAGLRSADGPGGSAGLRTPASAVWLPLAVCIVNALGWWALVHAQRHRLPDPVATHWGAGGHPDGFSAVHSVLTTNLVLCLAIPLPLLLLGVVMRQARAFAPVVAGTSVLLGIELWGSVWAQRDHAQATTGDVVWPLPVGLLAGALVAALVWLLVRQPDVPAPVSAIGLDADAPVLDLPGQGRLAWTGHTRTGRGAYWMLGLGVGVPVLLGLVLVLASREWTTAWSMALTAGIVLVALSCLRCRVSVDARGVRAVGAGVIPWVRIPLDSVLEASVEEVSPMAQFGGWGLRARLGRRGSWGLITSAGPALRVRREGKGDMYLTIDDAERAAAVLNTLVVRRAAAALPGS